MIRVLLEGRDAPLYHCTSLPSAIKILESGYIKRSRFSTGNGVSLTRDKNYWVGASSQVQFVVDQRKLSHNVELVPVAERHFSKGSRYFEAEEVAMSDISVSKYVYEVDIAPDVVGRYREACNLAGIFSQTKDIIYVTDKSMFTTYQSEVLKLMILIRDHNLSMGKYLSEASTMLQSNLHKLEY